MDKIEAIFKKAKFPYVRDGEKLGLVMLHDCAQYIISFGIQEDWLTMIADFPEYEKSVAFYQEVLRLNALLNPGRLCIANNKLALISDRLVEEVDEYTLLRQISYFHQAHLYIWQTLSFQ